MGRGKRRNGYQVSLFPFLDILSGVIGTFFLIIAAMTILSIETAVQVIQLPYVEAREKQPVYVDCRADGLFIPDHPPGYRRGESPPESVPDQDADPGEAAETDDPGGLFVPLAELDTPGNAWLRHLDSIEANRFTEYLILLVRHDGLESFRLARSAARQRGLDVGYTPVPGGGRVLLELPAGVELPAESEDEFDFELGDFRDDNPPQDELVPDVNP